MIRIKILADINTTIENNIGTNRVVISLGLSEYELTDNKFHTIFERADNLMYARKKQLKSMGAVTRE